jgi:hypothetical protein
MENGCLSIVKKKMVFRECVSGIIERNKLFIRGKVC